MRFLDPKTEFAFMKIFGSEQSHEFLLSFLNAVLNLHSPYRIVEVTLLDPCQAPRIVGMLSYCPHVRACDEAGKSYLIKMQVLNAEGFEQGVLYDACMAHSTPVEREGGHRVLTDVIALTFTTFFMFPDRSEVVSRFQLRANDCRLYGEDLELVFVELPKFDKDETQLVDVQDKWFYFLKNAGMLGCIPTPLASEAPIRQALDIANYAGLTRAEDDIQDRCLFFIQDQRYTVLRAGLAGLKKGHELAIQQFTEDCAQAERLHEARGLLSTLDDATIAGITKLTIGDIAALREEWRLAKRLEWGKRTRSPKGIEKLTG
ncbi:Rpn family recombination-promoting nuclease/putative transposase [Chitinimonas arctica]|uniref:Rpn family recombination-promoting nuclease/putative transposase n=1 Tax=Chitinimonas arctica TaxID=2594795 RepID=UPI001CC47980|nr:Rpn family recombination-promoting nuclease/putative transposase [Chitinimonas arctica]